MAAADPAALLGAAVRAAVLARAPRRTVQAVAAAVTGVLVRPTADASQRSAKQVPAEDTTGRTDGDACDGASAEELVQALRMARAARRRKKKQSRRLRKAQGTQEKSATRGGEKEAETVEEAEDGVRDDSFSSPVRRNLQFDEPAFQEPQAGTVKEPKVLEDLDPENPEDFLRLVQAVNDKQGTQFEAAQFTTEAERNIICNAAIFGESIADAMIPNVKGLKIKLPPGSPLRQYGRQVDGNQARLPGEARSKPYGPSRGTSARQQQQE